MLYPSYGFFRFSSVVHAFHVSLKFQVSSVEIIEKLTRVLKSRYEDGSLSDSQFHNSKKKVDIIISNGTLHEDITISILDSEETILAIQFLLSSQKTTESLIKGYRFIADIGSKIGGILDLVKFYSGCFSAKAPS